MEDPPRSGQAKLDFEMIISIIKEKRRAATRLFLVETMHLLRQSWLLLIYPTILNYQLLYKQRKRRAAARLFIGRNHASSLQYHGYN